MRTSSSIRRAPAGAIFGIKPFVCVSRRELRLTYKYPGQFRRALIQNLIGFLLPASEQLRIDSPRSIRSPLYPHVQQDICREVPNRLPIRIIVSGRRTAIRVGRFTQVQTKSISDYFRFLSWLVAPVDLLGNHTRGVTQSVGAIDRKRGIFTQDKNTGAGGVRRRQSRNLARPGDWLQGR